jgi:hypothetical protein
MRIKHPSKEFMSQKTFKIAISSGDSDDGVGSVFSGSLGGAISVSFATGAFWTLSEKSIPAFSFFMSFN